MNAINAPVSLDLDLIADALVETGYFLQTLALPADLTADLLTRVTTLRDAEFQRAGVGREQEQHLDNAIRRDRIHWLSQNDPTEAHYLALMDRLRTGMNERLFMGLFDYEAHFAHYPEGAFYKRHYDAFRGRTNRVLTTVFYLNPNWHAELGGQMRLFESGGLEDDRAPLEEVLPMAGTLAVFLSDRFPHEVMPAFADRYSIAGWFRVNGSIGNHIDPPR